MHAQILKEKEEAYGPPADLNDDGRTLRSETAAFLAGQRSRKKKEEEENEDDESSEEDNEDNDDDDNGDNNEDDEDDATSPKGVEKRLTFASALSPIGDRSQDEDDMDADSRRQSSASTASAFVPDTIDAPTASVSCLPCTIYLFLLLVYVVCCCGLDKVTGCTGTKHRSRHQRERQRKR